MANWNWKLNTIKNNKVYLIIVYYKDATTETIYKHSQDKLNKALNDLCEDKKVFDFVVFEKLDIEPEPKKEEK